MILHDSHFILRKQTIANVKNNEIKDLNKCFFRINYIII